MTPTELLRQLVLEQDHVQRVKIADKLVSQHGFSVTPLGGDDAHLSVLQEADDSKAKLSEPIQNAQDAVMELRAETERLEGGEVPSSKDEMARLVLGGRRLRGMASKTAGKWAQDNIVAVLTDGTGGRSLNSNYIVHDSGIGMNTEIMSQAIDRINHSTKRGKPYLVGQWGNGMAKLLCFCDSRLITTRRHPDVLAADNKRRASEGLADLPDRVSIGFSYRVPADNFATFRWVTLRDPDGLIPTVDPSTLIIIPWKDQTRNRSSNWDRPTLDDMAPLKHGTIVEYGNYQGLPRVLNNAPSGSLYHTLRTLLAGTLLPVSAMELRDLSERGGKKEDVKGSVFRPIVGLDNRVYLNVGNGGEHSFEIPASQDDFGAWSPMIPLAIGKGASHSFRASFYVKKRRALNDAERKDPRYINTKAKNHVPLEAWRSRGKTVIVTMDGFAVAQFDWTWYVPSAHHWVRHLRDHMIIHVDISSFPAGLKQMLVTASRSLRPQSPLGKALQNAVTSYLRNDDLLRQVAKDRMLAARVRRHRNVTKSIQVSNTNVALVRDYARKTKFSRNAALPDKFMGPMKGPVALNVHSQTPLRAHAEGTVTLRLGSNIYPGGFTHVVVEPAACFEATKPLVRWNAQGGGEIKIKVKEKDPARIPPSLSIRLIHEGTSLSRKIPVLGLAARQPPSKRGSGGNTNCHAGPNAPAVHIYRKDVRDSDWSKDSMVKLIVEPVEDSLSLSCFVCLDDIYYQGSLDLSGHGDKFRNTVVKHTLRCLQSSLEWRASDAPSLGWVEDTPGGPSALELTLTTFLRALASESPSQSAIERTLSIERSGEDEETEETS